MSKDTAYVSTNPDVVKAWVDWETKAREINAARQAMEEAVGRRLYVSGHGHTSNVVGFERFDSDKDGDLIHHDGCLVVSSRRGSNSGRVVTNSRRKSGREFQSEINALTIPAPGLPGMPTMHVYGSGLGLVMGSPALWLLEGDAGPFGVYALWGCSDAPVDAEFWVPIPLSQYHAALEAKEKHNG